MKNNYSYQATLETSERIGWRVEDIIGGEKRLDFTKPFMPEPLAQVKQLSFLTPDEQRILNQIRGYEYLAMFGLVEEFILLSSSLPVRRQSTFIFSSDSGRNLKLVSASSVISSAPQRM
jgi:hypothetical protein